MVPDSILHCTCRHQRLSLPQDQKPHAEDYSDIIGAALAAISQFELSDTDISEVKEMLSMRFDIASRTLDFSAYLDPAALAVPKTRGITKFFGSDTFEGVTSRDVKVVSTAWRLFVDDQRHAHLQLLPLIDYSADAPRSTSELSRNLKKRWMSKQMLA